MHTAQNKQVQNFGAQPIGTPTICGIVNDTSYGRRDFGEHKIDKTEKSMKN